MNKYFDRVKRYIKDEMTFAEFLLIAGGLIILLMLVL